MSVVLRDRSQSTIQKYLGILKNILAFLMVVWRSFFQHSDRKPSRTKRCAATWLRRSKTFDEINLAKSEKSITKPLRRHKSHSVIYQKQISRSEFPQTSVFLRQLSQNSLIQHKVKGPVLTQNSTPEFPLLRRFGARSTIYENGLAALVRLDNQQREPYTSINKRRTEPLVYGR